MITVSLSSGSQGNCFYVQSGEVRLIIEAGITGKSFQEKLSRIGQNPHQIKGILITHEHQDHAGGAGVLHRKFNLPLYATQKTAEVLTEKIRRVKGFQTFSPGEELMFGHVRVQTLPAMHDCLDGVHFIVDDGKYRAGFFTDIGRPYDLLHAALSTLDIIYLESNYDSRMLKDCHYPESVKERIRGGMGHLSNLQSAQMVRYYVSDRLKHLVLCHISENANTYSNVLSIHNRLHGGSYRITLAPRDEISEVISFGESLQSKTPRLFAG